MDTNAITACSGGTLAGFLVAGPVPLAPFVAPGAPTPTLSEWAMVVLAALLAIAGFAAMRRRAR
jgi:hypothetical protein